MRRHSHNPPNDDTIDLINFSNDEVRDRVKEWKDIRISGRLGAEEIAILTSFYQSKSFRDYQCSWCKTWTASQKFKIKVEWWRRSLMLFGIFLVERKMKSVRCSRTNRSACTSHQVKINGDRWKSHAERNSKKKSKYKMKNGGKTRHFKWKELVPILNAALHRRKGSI